MSSRDPDKLLDHDYDGIKEFDNPLPKWWLWLFYGCIIWSAIYVPWAHLGGHLPGAEYEAEVKEAEAAHPRKRAGRRHRSRRRSAVDQERHHQGQGHVRQALHPCHGPQAGGLVGPNLTDNHWIHGGKMQNIVKTITERRAREGHDLVEVATVARRDRQRRSVHQVFEGDQPRESEGAGRPAGGVTTHRRRGPFAAWGGRRGPSRQDACARPDSGASSCHSPKTTDFPPSGTRAGASGSTPTGCGASGSSAAPSSPTCSSSSCSSRPGSTSKAIRRSCSTSRTASSTSSG
jgi:hypothetical protein